MKKFVINLIAKRLGFPLKELLDPRRRASESDATYAGAAVTLLCLYPPACVAMTTATNAIGAVFDMPNLTPAMVVAMLWGYASLRFRSKMKKGDVEAVAAGPATTGPK